MTEDKALLRFVEASDKLVNLLSTKPQPRPVMIRVHEKAIETAMDEYDAARRDLMGSDKEEE